MKNKKVLFLTQNALLTALVLLLSFVPQIGYIKLPILAIQATTVHIPVIVGSILLGWKSGAFLGGVFGLTSLINNTTAPGLISFCFSPFVSMGEGLGGSPLALVVCFVPRILCGILPYFVYKLLKNRCGDKLSCLFGGVVGSMTNTILVMGMIYLFFAQSYAAAKEIAVDAVFGAILSVVATNGIGEAIIAALLSSAVVIAVQKSGITKRG